MVKQVTDQDIAALLMRPRRILFIEDEQYVRDVFRIFSARYNCMMEACESGLEGLELLRTKTFDTVFLDIRLPGMDGHEVFRLIRILRPEIDVVVISGFLTDDVITTITDIGFAIFVKKPSGMRPGVLHSLFRLLRIEKIERDYLPA